MIETNQAIDGLRPFTEYSALLEEACPILKQNPALKYKIVGKVGKGGFGTIFKVQRIEDGQPFALKFTNPKDRAERQDVINECSLMAYLNCD